MPVHPFWQSNCFCCFSSFQFHSILTWTQLQWKQRNFVKVVFLFFSLFLGSSSSYTRATCQKRTLPSQKVLSAAGKSSTKFLSLAFVRKCIFMFLNVCVLLKDNCMIFICVCLLQRILQILKQCAKHMFFCSQKNR